MGRPPSNGGPPFRFNVAEVVEMETILQDHNNMMPAQEVLVAIADKFSNSPERQGKFVVQTKQIWNWFQNKRYAIRARTSKIPTKSNVSSMQSVSMGVPLQSAPVVSTMPAAQAMTAMPVAPSVPVISREDDLSSSRLPHSVADAPGRIPAENSQLEFEARSGRDSAWYDVASFLSLRNLEAGCPEVLVRFAGFGPEEDEWINVMTHVRHRSLPCESSECVAVLPGDLILCFQEGKEQALYFDAHVLDAQRRRHDARGCRCRFLVRYDHDQSEEIVPLRKICRRPETDYRLQQLHAMNESSADHMKSAPAKEQNKIVSSVEQIKTDVDSSSSKAGISDHVTLSDQKLPAPILLVNASSMSEELNGAAICSTDRTAGDINAASNSIQLSHPEVINLDPEIEVENTSREVQDATDDMDVDEPLEKTTDITSKCGIGATDNTCLPVENTDGTPMCGINDKDTQNMAVESVNQASLAVGTEPAPKTEQVDLEPMMVEMSRTTFEGKTNIDQAKDELISTSSTDTSLTRGAITPISSRPADAVVDEVTVEVPETTSSMGNVTLEQNVIQPSEANSTDAGKTDVDSGNATLEQNVLETNGATAIDVEKTDVDSGNATLSGAINDTDHPVDHSGPSNASITNADVENCLEKVDDI